MTTAIVAWLQSCLQCRFMKWKKINPLEMVVVHTIVMVCAAATLGVDRFGEVLTLRGNNVTGREYSLALAAGLAGCLSSSFLLLLWTVIIWNMNKYNRGTAFNAPQPQQWPNPQTHQQWQTTQQPMPQGIYGPPQYSQHNMTPVPGQTYTYDGTKFVAASFVNEMGVGDNVNGLPAYMGGSGR
ncbi:hypothetical protein GLAREA_05782 [Glarea lozoyensis ATCC 20868]|uniref:Uncharacterized protein n=1 Tax=Glarea lozoyensis (strain ATCC 20868 / MF5171) TaxID=1116229 RepID=S3DH22_GLAL2|nr:uncharacterized protein GLAREA_05782 [Glarea lozoyensis ATCC 20868]EPE36444.1 hypothetical protein GLAREA_05782 [Glarea lozoyensis ATCC 20868]